MYGTRKLTIEWNLSYSGILNSGGRTLIYSKMNSSIPAAPVLTIVTPALWVGHGVAQFQLISSGTLLKTLYWWDPPIFLRSLHSATTGSSNGLWYRT